MLSARWASKCSWQLLNLVLIQFRWHSQFIVECYEGMWLDPDLMRPFKNTEGHKVWFDHQKQLTQPYSRCVPRLIYATDAAEDYSEGYTCTLSLIALPASFLSLSSRCILGMEKSFKMTQIDFWVTGRNGGDRRQGGTRGMTRALGNFSGNRHGCNMTW